MPAPSLALVEADLRRRADTDKEMSFGLHFVLWWVFIWLWQYVSAYQLFDRRNKHFERQQAFQRDCLQTLKELADQKGKAAALQQDFDRMEELLREAQLQERPKEPLLWGILLPLITLGLIYFFSFSILMGEYRRHFLRQAEFHSTMSHALTELGVARALLPDQSEIPERNGLLYAVLTLVTIFIFAIYWWYVMFKDPNDHFAKQAFVEDDIVAALRTL